MFKQIMQKVKFWGLFLRPENELGEGTWVDFYAAQGALGYCGHQPFLSCLCLPLWVGCGVGPAKCNKIAIYFRISQYSIFC